MSSQQIATKLLARFEFLFERYSNESRANTQPYQLAKVRHAYPDYAYNPGDPLIRETLIEHIGSTPLVAIELYPYLDDPEIDLGEALTMLAIHDIGEVITGDKNIFIKSQTQEKLEQKAALELLHPNFHTLYKDVESQLSPTAKFAKAVDKITPDILDYLTPIKITIQRYKHFTGVEPNEIYNLVLTHKRPYMLWNPFMTEFHTVLVKSLADRIKNSSI